ncbi:MAG: protein kinase [Gemmatimonadetes bacterium]|nr:protein kinase [Gemmatimonadota bacterium]
MLERLNRALAGRYRVERELGRGGMATVFLAHDLRLDRMVAIKVFAAGRPMHLEASRFEREIRIAARLTHPQIVPVHDSGEADGLLYYVMPLIEGESLRDRLKREGRLSVTDAVRIARTVARALDYAHRQGYVHRDIKPENILLHEGGALVADFGVAMALREACAPDDTSTAPGLAVGTPAYMSPEQAAGERDLDGRTDQYAVACVLYEMLAGQPPFSGSARQIMLRHVVEPPPSVRVVRPDVPWPVDGALLRAMAKEPLERFESAADWADALTARSGEVEAAGGASNRRRALAVLPFVNATGDPGNEYLSDGMTDELISALANVAGLKVASRTSAFALKGRPEDVRSLGALLGVGTVLEGTVRKAGNRIRLTVQLSDAADGRLLWSERFDRDDEDIFAIQDEITATIVRTLRSRLLGDLGEPVPKRYTENPRAYNLYLRGRFAWNQRSSEGMRQAISFFEQAIGEDADYALAWSGLADAYAIGVDYRNGPVAEGFERAKELARRAIALDDSLAEAHTSLAWVTFIHDWDWATAEREFRRAIDANPNYASAHQWYAWLLASQGRLNEALRAGERAVELDAASVSVRRGLGWLHFYARDWHLALEHMRRALAMNPTALESILVLAMVFNQAGRPAEAEAVLRDGLSVAPDDTALLAVLGRALVLQGRRPEAESIRERFTSMSATRYVSPTDRAKLALALGLWDEAFAFAEQSRVERRGWIVYMRVDPLWDPLRDDPRYRALLKAMAIPGA